MTVAFALVIGSVLADENRNAKTESLQPGRDTRKPSISVDDTFQRFLDELVAVEPGRGIFPESSTVNDRLLRPSEPFRISRYETTQELFTAVMEENPSRWKGPRNSVDSVTRKYADEFCLRLTSILRRKTLIGASQTVRLPTADEWEYCCRAGSRGNYCFSDNTPVENELQTLSEYAWHRGNAAGNDPAVGVLQPNAWGLYDMHGYLWEFVDPSDRPAENAAEDPDTSSPAMGGSWGDPARRLTSDSSLNVPLDSTNDTIGFRCVVSGVSDEPTQ